MKILTSDQTHSWDDYTIAQESISSTDLMERAATACTTWLLQHYSTALSFAIFCGKGNNGGDGLAIARMLLDKGHTVQVYILESDHQGTGDFQVNLKRLNATAKSDVLFIRSSESFPSLSQQQVIVDALLGSGLNRPVDGTTAALIQHLNGSGRPIVSIDIPSGLFGDQSSLDQVSVHATDTLSFQRYKLAFLLAENAASIGHIHLLDIGLNTAFEQQLPVTFELLDRNIIGGIYRSRKRFSHKGNFGHALLVAGSHGKMGAAVLAARACLHSGVGLLTCHVPGDGYTVLQSTVPEAMTSTDAHALINTKSEEELSLYKSIGIGPGLGTASETMNLLRTLMESYRKPMVIDADALNIIGRHQGLIPMIPADSILTPHPKEFERVFGSTFNEYQRIQLAVAKAKELRSVIVLKGHHTLIATPEGKAYFNNTGNAGMATGGSGDVLTGILTGLHAQGYSPVEAALMGVWLHGVAGDLAATQHSMEAMTAGNIVEQLGAAFLSM